MSVIIPVYNSLDYVTSALESTRKQGLGEDQIEVIAVDDGSTDGSGAVLDAFAAHNPHVTVLHQENSGGPGAPRNAGLDRAHGTFVFFLDADDELTRNALRDLTTFAERCDSDIVLAKVKGRGGRKIPRSMFKQTKKSADIVADHLLDTMGPWKLYRRDLIERNALRFPSHLRRGEDPPFVMAAYLAAARISVFADRNCYVLRKRADGGNLTNSKSDPIEALDRMQALIEVILERTDPGTYRDALMRRPLQFLLPSVMKPNFRNLDPGQRRLVATRMRTLVGPHLNAETLTYLSPVQRIKAKLLVWGLPAAVCWVLWWEGSRAHLATRGVLERVRGTGAPAA